MCVDSDECDVQSTEYILSLYPSSGRPRALIDGQSQHLLGVKRPIAMASRAMLSAEQIRTGGATGFTMGRTAPRGSRGGHCYQTTVVHRGECNQATEPA